MSADIEIIIGTYEEFLLGYKIVTTNDELKLVQSFADKSHSGSIRCVAVHDHWVASGGTDDRIFIYDMSTRTQSQIILSHEGTINSLAFTPDGTHLLSGGDDGHMIATRLKTWCTDATWKKAHNGCAVTHISCHPSGKLALSLGSDLVLRTWNLVKGRVAYKTNLKSRNTLGVLPDCLAWSSNGDYFSIAGQRILEFWSIKTADVVRSHTTDSKPVCLVWITNNACVVGLDDGKILWLSPESEEKKEIVAHNARVKALSVFKQNLVSASSSGEVKLWKIIYDGQLLKEVATINIGCRPTCISILDLQQFGDNYVIGSKLGVEENDTKPTSSKVTVPNRGVVTIEYENEDINEKEQSEEEDDDSANNEFEDAENEDDSVAEEDDDDNVDSFEEDSDDSNLEPEIPLPKSSKHKLQMLKNKEHAEKKPRLNKVDKMLKKNNCNKQQKKIKNKFK